jgi:LacI family transcriptional regulator
VLLDRKAIRSGQCSVSVDDVAGGKLAVGHLIEGGHRRIAFVGGGATLQVRDRKRGALAALRAAGAPADNLVVVAVEPLNVEGGREAARQLLAQPARTRPTAAFCVNDLMALGLLQELTRVGVAVPDQMALIGYDDIDFAGAAAVPLSSVRQPRHELGRTAARLLAEETSGRPHRHQRMVFLPELAPRESSGAGSHISSNGNAARRSRAGAT